MTKATDTTAVDAKASEQTTPDVPEEFKDRSLGWRLAYQHAVNWRNPHKACVLFADSHQEEFGGEQAADVLQKQIDSLQDEIDALPPE